MAANLNHFRRTKIICTIGPATSSPEALEKLARAGMDIARLNLSHGTEAEHAQHVRDLRDLSQKLDLPLAILMDLPGPKYRVGPIKGDGIVLERGDTLTITTRQVEGDDKLVSVILPTLPQVVKKGDTILLDDGYIQLEVVQVAGSEVKSRVVAGGTLRAGRGIAVPNMPALDPFLTPQTLESLRFAAAQRPDFLAVSLVSQAADVTQVREILRQKGATARLIAKIERGRAVENFDSILEVSDSVMVARGDLGVDIPLQRVPLVQKEIIRKCNLAGKPVITATQMLESMVNTARPTRAEVTDVANAIFDGTDALLLSSETAIGRYPLQAVEIMAQIAQETEGALPYAQILSQRATTLTPQTDEAIAYNACYTAHYLGAAAIVAFTKSGSTVQRVSKYRPRTPILAITSSPEVRCQLALSWGVRSYLAADPATVDELFAQGARLARELGYARKGDLIVITCGIPLGIAGTTNLLRVEQIN